MDNKEYTLKLVIDVNLIKVIVPSGKQFKLERYGVPVDSVIHDITQQCLLDDAELCQHIVRSMRKPGVTDLPPG